MKQTYDSDIKNISLAGDGLKRIDRAWKEMLVLQALEARFTDARSLNGIRLSGCLHTSTETANRALVLKLPDEIDKEIARLKLAVMNINIDTLTAEQIKYLSSWQEGA